MMQNYIFPHINSSNFTFFRHLFWGFATFFRHLVLGHGFQINYKVIGNSVGCFFVLDLIPDNMNL